MTEQRNLIVAIGLSIAIFIAWTIFFPPAPPPGRSDQPTSASSSTAPASTGAPALPGIGAAPAPGMTRDQVLAQSERVEIDAPRVAGSINLTGARLDDLHLRDYRESIDDNSDTIILLSPRGASGAYYAEFGWIATPGSSVAVPDTTTKWEVEKGSRLATDVPITLKWDNGQGLIFRITYGIDRNYMFTVTQEVENRGTGEAALTPYGVISRFEAPTANDVWFLHEGFVGWLGDSLKNRKWKKLRNDGGISLSSTGGWMGFADKYWLAALAPPQNESFTGSVGFDRPEGTERFASAYQLEPKAIAPGRSVEVESHFFAGAKEVKTINAYKNGLGIKRFDLAIDWGWFRFLTEPLFFLLDFFAKQFGNFGVGILLVTVCVKILFFPLANRSYETMSKMKKLQPQLKDIQDRYKDDKVELQKQMMGLYQKEKINPLAGCLPVLLQIPVWYSLYNVLFITIEMRHAPFFGWIQDLSAKDPTSLLNLFGLLPFDTPVYLTIGAWPLIMGLTMFLQTSLNPAPTDPTQKFVFTWMPVIFTLMLASFPAGLVIYWTWNNLLSIAQQAVIMTRMGTPPDFRQALGINVVAKLLAGAKRRARDKHPADDVPSDKDGADQKAADKVKPDKEQSGKGPTAKVETPSGI